MKKGKSIETPKPIEKMIVFYIHITCKYYFISICRIILCMNQHTTPMNKMELIQTTEPTILIRPL
jgi:hypothetical protein